MAVVRGANAISCYEFSAASYYDFTYLTVGSESNRALVVQIAWTGGDPGTITVTWDQGGTNQACSLIKNEINARRAQLWGLVNPTAGNKTLRIISTAELGCIVNATYYYNVDQTGGTTTFPNATSATGTGTTASVTITSQTGNKTVDCMSGATGIGTPTQSQLFFMSGSGAQDGGASEGSGAASVVHQWTISDCLWAEVGTDIKAVSEGVSGSGPHQSTIIQGNW